MYNHLSVHSLAVYVEHMSTVYTCLDTLIVSTTLADRLYMPFKAIVFSPIVSVIASLVIYIIFSILFFPLWLVSFIVTPWGSVGVLFLCIFVLGRSVARTIAFPGSTMSLQREYSADFMRRFTSQLESTGTCNIHIYTHVNDIYMHIYY